MAAPLLRRSRAWIAAVAVVVVGVVLATAASAGFFDRNPYELFSASGPRSGLAALYFSGDMGLRYGMGPYTSAALARHGVPVLGFSSPTIFRLHRTRAEVDKAVADSVRLATERSGGARLILIGQSFGADILQTGLADLPADLRQKVASVILVVPSRAVYFRADPTDIAYRGTPDSDGAATVNRITWTPLTCIYGAAEPDSLCPLVRASKATLVRHSGGHFLDHDSNGIVAAVFAGIRRAVPAATL